MFQRLIREPQTTAARADMPEPPALAVRRWPARQNEVRVRITRRKPMLRCSSSKCPPLFYLLVGARSR